MGTSIVGFCKHNKHKWLTFRLYCLTCFYRMCVKLIPDKKLRRFMGQPGQATGEVTLEQYRYARLVGYHLNRVATHTPWLTNCLCRTLTVKHLMNKKDIPYTLYLGVGKDENQKMIAHSWISVGELFVSGGNGEEYACVAKFTNEKR